MPWRSGGQVRRSARKSGEPGRREAVSSKLTPFLPGYSFRVDLAHRGHVPEEVCGPRSAAATDSATLQPTMLGRPFGERDTPVRGRGEMP